MGVKMNMEIFNCKVKVPLESKDDVIALSIYFSLKIGRNRVYLTGRLS